METISRNNSHAKNSNRADSGGVFNKTVNNGMDWEKLYQIRESMITTTGIQFIDENNGYCLLRDSILHTTNGGTIWNTINSKDGGDKFILHNSTFYLINKFGYDIFKSDDFCVSYYKISQDIPYEAGLIEDIFITPNETVMVVTDKGYIFKLNK